MNYCIAGIHTGIGKTMCSAIICEALGYDYWKPVQAGDLDQSDSLFIRSHVSNPLCTVHPERYKLLTAASPHYAAEKEHISIQREDFRLPETRNNLIIETAGGLMSPLSSSLLNIDLAAHFQVPVILVSNNYLGSINHTLLSYTLLAARNISIAGLVFVGEPVASSEEFILNYTGLPLLFSIPWFKHLNKDVIREFAAHHPIHLTDHG